MDAGACWEMFGGVSGRVGGLVNRFMCVCVLVCVCVCCLLSLQHIGSLQLAFVCWRVRVGVCMGVRVCTRGVGNWVGW